MSLTNDPQSWTLPGIADPFPYVGDGVMPPQVWTESITPSERTRRLLRKILASGAIEDEDLIDEIVGEMAVLSVVPGIQFGTSTTIGSAPVI